MANTIWDLKPTDEVKTRSYGLVQFIGFYAEGLECLISRWLSYTRPDGTKARRPINERIPTSELIVDGE